MPTNQSKRVTDLETFSAGLDALETSKRQKTNWAKRVLTAIAPLLAIVIIIAIWEALYKAKVVEDWVLPGPGQVFAALKSQYDQGLLIQSAFNSLRKAAEGFAISLVLATVIGLLLGTNKVLRIIFRPILTGLQQLPSVAWVPASIIWFGLSDTTLFAVILLGAVPSIANGLISGLDQIAPIYLKAGKVLGAKGLSKVWHILIPAAWPGFLQGLEQGWAFAWRSLMAAELIAVSPELGPGLGQMLDTGRQLGDMALVLGAILTIMITGVLIERLVFTPLRTFTLKNRGLIA
jgi:NitT/TauT family transport system permease protein